MDDGWTCALSLLQRCGFQPDTAAVDHAPCTPIGPLTLDQRASVKQNRLLRFLSPLVFFLSREPPWLQIKEKTQTKGHKVSQRVVFDIASCTLIM